MKSWTVKYGTRKCQIAVTGYKLVQTVIKEAALQFSIDATCCYLFRTAANNAEIHPSITCQLAHIGDDEDLRLMVGEKREDTDPKTTVELTVFGMTGKISQEFNSSTSLLGVLAELVSQEKVDGSVCVKDPEMVFVGKGVSFKGDTLQTTTLESLSLCSLKSSFFLKHSSDFSLSCLRNEELKLALEEAIAIKVFPEITLRTLLTYVDNVLSDPSDERFRIINMSNGKYQERIGAVDGAREVLTMIGFQNTLTIGPVEPKIFLGGVDVDVIPRLEIAKKCLKDALKSFGGSEAKTPRVVQRKSNSSSSTPTVQFPGKGRRVDGNEVTPEKQSGSSKAVDLTREEDDAHGGAIKRKRTA